MTNTEQQNDIYILSGDMCYDNKLMASSASIQHPPEAIYLNVHETSHPCTRNGDERKWYRKYFTCGRGSDFMFTILIMAFTVLVEFGYVPHPNIGFYCADPMLSHRFTGDTITATHLFMGTFLGPLLVIYLVEINRCEKRASLNKMWLWYRGYLICLLSFLMLCQALKVCTGEHRPHFLHTCAPDAAEICSPGDYITEYHCLNTGGFKGYIVPDSSLSFPSGHAGIATITSLFCAIFIHKRFNKRHTGVMAKPALVTIVLTWGIVVGISRIQDHRHHWWDVLAGTGLGIIFVIYTVIFHCYSFVVRVNESSSTENTCISAIRHSTNKQHASTSTLVDVNSKDKNKVII